MIVGKRTLVIGMTESIRNQYKRIPPKGPLCCLASKMNIDDDQEMVM